MPGGRSLDPLPQFLPGEDAVILPGAWTEMRTRCGASPLPGAPGMSPEQNACQVRKGPLIGLGDTGPRVSALWRLAVHGGQTSTPRLAAPLCAHVCKHRECLHRGRRWAAQRELSAQSRSWISARSSSAPHCSSGHHSSVKGPQEPATWGNTGAAPHLGVTQEPPAASRLPGTPTPWKLRRHLW